VGVDAHYRSIDEVFDVRDELSGEPVRFPVSQVLDTGSILARNEGLVLIRRDGQRYAIADSASAIHIAGGDRWAGAVILFRERGNTGSPTAPGD